MTSSIYNDGTSRTVYSPGNTILVAVSGGDFTSLSAALASITDASASNPYLIRVAPGIYDETIDLKNYVDIEGSGEGVTILHGPGGNTNPFTDGSSATLRANGILHAEVRWLTVESDGVGMSYAIAIWTGGASATLRFTHVTAGASGGAYNIGVYNKSSSPNLRNFTASASGGTNSYGGYSVNSSSPTIQDSALTGATNSINNISSSSAKIVNTMLAGPTTGAGSFTCFNTYNASFAAVACP